MFAQELPALQQWRFLQEDAARISQPALVMVGAVSSWPGFREGTERLIEWLPAAEESVLPAATHGQQMAE